MIICLPLLAIVALLLLYRWYRQSYILENLSDKYVFITGCDTGFGNHVAKQLDRRGMKVLASCMTETGAENLKKEASSRLQTVILDVTDEKSVISAVKWISSIVGNAGLWGLVNNAGFGFALAPNEWQDLEDFTHVVNVNLLGLINVTVQLLPLVRKAKGRIVNVSSVMGRLASIGGGYTVSKYGVEAFSDSLRREMRAFGVKVSIIEPGAFQTVMAMSADMHRSNLKRLWDRLPAAVKESYGERYYDEYIKTLEAITNSTSPRLNLVTDCMEHALTAVYPWTRYAAGWDSKLYFVPMSYLPTAISDYLLSLSAPKPASK